MLCGELLGGGKVVRFVRVQSGRLWSELTSKNV